MSMRIAVGALLLLHGVLAIPPRLASPGNPEPPHVPELHGNSFAGDPVNFPEALRGHTAVLIVGFSQNSREAVTQWSRRFAADYRDSPHVLYYEFAVLTDVPKFLRGFVIGKIRKDVPGRDQARFVPILDHEAEWKAAVGFGGSQGADEAYLLLVDGSGRIAYRVASTAPNDASYADLKGRLQAIHP